MCELYEQDDQDKLAEDDLVDLAEIDEVFAEASADYADIESGKL